MPSAASHIDLIMGASPAAQRPTPGRLVEFEFTDANRSYLADNLTPSRAASLLKAADSGDVASALQLFEEITDRDGRLMSLLRKRRLALTGLEYQIVSAADAALAREGGVQS